MTPEQKEIALIRQGTIDMRRQMIRATDAIIARLDRLDPSESTAPAKRLTRKEAKEMVRQAFNGN